MKKRIRLISLAILFVVVVSSAVWLSSCAKLGSTLTIGKINKAMEKLDSYEMSTTINIKYYVDGEPVDYKNEKTTIVDGMNKSDFYYYSLSNIEVEADKLDVDQKMMVVEAYSDGNFYLRNKTDGRREIKLYGKMGIEKFKGYINPEGYSGINLNDCKNVRKWKNSDGTSTIEYSGYSSSTLSALVGSLGIQEYLLGSGMKDVTVTLIYDKDHRIKRLSYSFAFDSEDGKTPVLSVWSTYSNYNSAVRTDKYIKPTGYQELDRISVLTDVAVALNKLANDKSGAFKFDLEQNVSYVGNKSNYKESNTVIYGERNGKFYYEIDSVSDGEKTKIKYSDGKQTATGSGSPAKKIDSDSAARSYIVSMMNPTGLAITNVYDVVSLGGDVYELKCFTDKTACYNLISQYGATYSSSTHTVKVTVSPYGDLTKMESDLEVQGYIRKGNSGYGLGIKLHAVNEYNVDAS